MGGCQVADGQYDVAILQVITKVKAFFPKLCCFKKKKIDIFIAYCSYSPLLPQKDVQYYPQQRHFSKSLLFLND
jgi:hypothetical protein